MLPAGYIELDSITSTGTQFIDIDFYPTSKSRIVLTAQFVQIPTEISVLFGAGQSSDVFLTFLSGTGKINMRHGSSSNYKVDGLATDKNIYDYNQNTLTVNSVNSVTAPEIDFSVPYSCYLFGLNNKGTLQYPASFTLFECYAYDAGLLKRHLIPCKNPSQEVGLYDLVSSRFFGNDGTGEFIAGNPVDPVVSFFRNFKTVEIPEGRVAKVTRKADNILIWEK